ncbi:MAG: hypothetical protein ACR2GY_11825 [Phycisphaerales bacterium]
MVDMITGRDVIVDIDHLLLVVVGAHLVSEVFERPLAYRLRESILRWKDEQNASRSEGITLEPVVISDLWYLNNDELSSRPTIAIGSPGTNALTAFLATHLPVALVLDNTLQVHLNMSGATMHACLWGVDTSATASAVDLFAERYLPEFLSRATERC